MGEISNCGSKTYRTAAVSGLTCGALRGQSTSTARRVTWRCAAQSAVQSRCHWLPLVDDIPCMYIQMYIYIYMREHKYKPEYKYKFKIRYTYIYIDTVQRHVHIWMCMRICTHVSIQRERDIKIQLSYENGYSPL